MQARPPRLRAAAARLAATILTPPVHHWILRQERKILSNGRPLNRGEQAGTRDIGLSDAARVRVLVVDRIPLPARWLWQRIARFSRAILGDPVALTAGHGIFLCRGRRDNLAVLRHELVHVLQYERLGRRAFLQQYIHDGLLHGYFDSPLEAEARRLSINALHD
jgi:hypothetical protein